MCVHDQDSHSAPPKEQIVPMNARSSEGEIECVRSMRRTTCSIEVFVTGTVPVRLSLDAFSLAFLRSQRNQNSPVLQAGDRLLFGP